MVTVAKRRGVFIEWRLVKMLALALMVLMLGVASFLLLGPTASERGTQSLVKAFSKRRLIEPRLSGGFKAGVFNPDKNDRKGINELELSRAEELIEDAVDDNNPKTQLAYGGLLMSTLNNADALRQFRKALAGAPESAEPHNDIGVCLMESGKLEDALEEFNNALKLKDAMPEALFNRGLCYERLLLRDAANEDYTRLVKVERDRSWVGEIKQRQQAMSAPIDLANQQAEIIKAFDEAVVEGNIDEAKQIAARDIEVLQKHACLACPVEYFKAIEGENKEQADRAMLEINLVGESFADASGDTSISDFASYLSKLEGEELKTEVDLINKYREAVSLVLRQNKGEFQFKFQELSKQFEERGNQLFRFYSDQGDAICDYSFGRYAASAEKGIKILATIDKQPWPYRRSEIWSNLGITFSRMGQDAIAVKYGDLALKHCSNVPALRSLILQYLATAYWHLGDINSGLARLRESSGLIFASGPQYIALANNALLTAEFYRLINNHSLALLYAKQALAFAEKKEKDGQNIISQSASFMAAEQARLNQFEQAQEQLNRAFAAADQMSPKQRSYSEYLALTRAAEIATSQNDIESALQFYAKAEAVVRNIEEQTVPLIRIMRGRAATHAEARDFKAASEDLQRAIPLIEQYLASLSERKNKSDFLDASHDVFDQMIALNIQALSNWPEAFNYSEQSRARTLLYDLSWQINAKGTESNAAVEGSQPQAMLNPMTLAEVRSKLPDDLRLVSYAVTDKGTFIFLVTRAGFEWAKSEATTDELDRLVGEYAADLKSMAVIDHLNELGHKLYHYLIEPVENKINDGKRLCIVPDKALHVIPFAALVDGSGKYLLEKYSLTYAPSSTVLALCLDESRKKGKVKDEKILAVGNPKFNRESFPGLKYLPDAEREANDSAALYPEKNRRVLIGPQATKSRVRAELADCNIAHFSLHCLVEEKTPLLAMLVLAEQEPEAGGSRDQSAEDSSSLYLKEVYGMSFPKTKLVILSACESALGQYFRGEGIVSLVRPFLARGVPSVVASLWRVDSKATAALMIDFHKERKTANPGAGDALRAAQLRMASSGSYQHPYYWAPFIVVGSND